MQILLDTHAFLWFISDSPQLSSTASAYMKDTDNTLYLSIASLWEIAIKVSVGKFTPTEPLERLFNEQMAANDISLLGMGISHLITLSSLTLHHRDPFDRLLIAQAIVEQMPLLSADSAFDSYPIQRLW